MFYIIFQGTVEQKVERVKISSGPMDPEEAESSMKYNASQRSGIDGGVVHESSQTENTLLSNCRKKGNQTTEVKIEGQVFGYEAFDESKMNAVN